MVENSRLQIAAMETEHAEKLKSLQEASALELEESKKARAEAESRAQSLCAENSAILKRVADAEAAVLQSQQELAQTRYKCNDNDLKVRLMSFFF